MNLPELYRLAAEEGPLGERARLVREQLDWFAALVDFDPKSGECIPLGVGTVLSRAAVRRRPPVARDRLWRIVEHCRPSIHRICRALVEAPRREREMLHVRSVRSLDPGSFAALSRRPGRNIREKLADKPVMLAPRTHQSVDLTQNRLFKEFLIRVADLMEVRKNSLGEDDELLADIRRWLKSDEALSISRWTHTPPNNVLLSHRDYRRVWDAWRWLESVDDLCARDFEQVESRDEVISEWEEWSRGYSSGQWWFGELPVMFDYDRFSVEKWCELIFTEGEMQPRATDATRFDGPVCVDLSYVCPRYAIAGRDERDVLPEKFVWQRWTRGDTHVEIDLFGADVIVVAPDENVTVSAPDLLSTMPIDRTVLERAASSFALRLSHIVGSNQMVWLVPDFVNDFELQVVRRNINARVPSSSPLPRSVAAVIEAVDYGSITSEDYVVVVTDEVGGTLCATKLVSRHDPELELRVPETRGFYWERTPTVVLSRDDEMARALDGVPHVFQRGSELSHLHNSRDRAVHSDGDLAHLISHADIGEYHAHVKIVESPVVGGVRVIDLQRRAGDLPVWRDQIPELSVKVLDGGLRTTFVLVSPHTTIRPIRGVAVPIPVARKFTLVADQAKFAFPLFQGSAASALGFQTELTSTSFPLRRSAVCTLHLTYTYGADDPYDLVFVPEDGSFPPVTARWGRQMNAESEDLSRLPVPQFPGRQDWAGLQRWPRLRADRKTGSMYSDLLDWVSGAVTSVIRLQSGEVPDSRVDEQVAEMLAARVTGVVVGMNRDRNNDFFCFAQVAGEDIFCHGREFLDKAEADRLQEGDRVHFQIDRSRGRPQGKHVTCGQRNPPGLAKRLARGSGHGRADSPEDVQSKLFKARFPSYTIWDHGRSINDADCPTSFRELVDDAVSGLLATYENQKMPENLRHEVFLFLARMHKDAPRRIVEELHLIAKKHGRLSRNERDALAYAVGDCTEQWQQFVLDRILACQFHEWTWMLSIALWRSEVPVSYVSIGHMKEILPRLFDALLEKIEEARSGRFGGVEPVLEVCLALLRTREAGDQSLVALFAPRSDWGTRYTELIDELTNIVVSRGHQLHTRVGLQVHKPTEYGRVPDLLYALRLYLTGDDGADAVRVTEVTWN